jgi:hypothetical protein
MSIADQIEKIDNSKLDTIVPNGLISVGAPKQNRYKTNKYLNEIEEEEREEKKLPTLPKAPVLNAHNPVV